MLKAFNSFQIVALYSAAPFGIQWLANAEFPGHNAALWTGVAGYLVYSVMMMVAVFIAIEKET